MTDPNTLSPPSLETHVAARDETFLDANELVINMGPQHPATHGVLRVILRLDGEKVMGLECVIGYLHRGVEKIAENRTYTMFNPYVDRMYYVAAYPPPTTGPAGEPVLELEGLYHRWKGPKPPVLDDVSLTLRAGEVTWIGGRNGAGKTTLLRLAAGILLPQRGNVRIGELTPASKRGLYRRQIGF